MPLTPSDLGLPPKFVRFRTEMKQEETIERLSISDHRNVILSAVPGSGKSPTYISSSIIRSDRTLILVPTKALQSQLYNDFSTIGLFAISGHSNYPCSVSEYDDSGDLLDSHCRSRGNCNYWDRDVIAARNSRFVVTNYAHWIVMSKMEDGLRLGEFDAVVMDEAHKAHEELVKQLTIRLSRRRVHQLLEVDMPPADSPITKWVLWARETRELAADRYRRRKKGLDDSPDNRRHFNDLIRLGKDLARLSKVSKSEEWVVERTTKGVQLTPLWGRSYAEQYLFRGVKRIVLSSGTITRDDAIELGCDPSDIDMIEVDSAYSRNRRPFYYIPTTPVDHRMSIGQKKLLVNRIDQFIEPRIGLHKGLIHSRSYDYRDDIMRLSEWGEFMMSHEKGETELGVKNFFSSEAPSLIVSPTITEGFDFFGDRARFQIIWKVPFLVRTDPITDARCKSDKLYATRVISRTILQIALRIIRSSEDWGETAIFDTHFGHFRRLGVFPNWFRSAWKECRSLPEPIKF